MRKKYTGFLLNKTKVKKRLNYLLLSLLSLLFFENYALSQATPSWINASTYRVEGLPFSWPIPADASQFDVVTSSPANLILNTNRNRFRFNKDIGSQTGGFFASGSSNLQFNTGTSNERMRILNSNGFVGINNTSPQHHLHIHGSTDYSIPFITEDADLTLGDEKSGSINDVGSTARFHLSNSTTGNGEFDGATIRQSENNFVISNYEDGYMRFDGGGSSLRLEEGKLFYPSSSLNDPEDEARINFHGANDNVLRLTVSNSDKYGILTVAAEETAALLVSTQYSGFDNSEINFKVTGGGEVFARKYTTTLNPFPDYVFEEEYNLMTLSDLRSHIETEKHLPNMPTANEIEENGADLGELNRKLVEKVEELTLYILELEERLSGIESEASPTNTEKNALLEERISRLEGLLEEMKN